MPHALWALTKEILFDKFLSDFLASNPKYILVERSSGVYTTKDIVECNKSIL